MCIIIIWLSVVACYHSQLLDRNTTCIFLLSLVPQLHPTFYSFLKLPEGLHFATEIPLWVLLHKAMRTGWRNEKSAGYLIVFTWQVCPHCYSLIRGWFVLFFLLFIMQHLLFPHIFSRFSGAVYLCSTAAINTCFWSCCFVQISLKRFASLYKVKLFLSKLFIVRET